MKKKMISENFWSVAVFLELAVLCPKIFVYQISGLYRLSFGLGAQIDTLYLLKKRRECVPETAQGFEKIQSLFLIYSV